VPDSRRRGDLTDLPFVKDPFNNPEGAALDCASIGTTMVGLPAHSAPLGIAFTHNSALPDYLRNGALITAHGSWNREPPRRHTSRTALGTTLRTGCGQRPNS
jgi:glucose/arabinose dehydrogenase